MGNRAGLDAAGRPLYSWRRREHARISGRRTVSRAEALQLLAHCHRCRKPNAADPAAALPRAGRVEPNIVAAGSSGSSVLGVTAAVGRDAAVLRSTVR